MYVGTEAFKIHLCSLIKSVKPVQVSILDVLHCYVFLSDYNYS